MIVPMCGRIRIKLDRCRILKATACILKLRMASENVNIFCFSFSTGCHTYPKGSRALAIIMSIFKLAVPVLRQQRSNSGKCSARFFCPLLFARCRFVYSPYGCPFWGFSVPFTCACPRLPAVCLSWNCHLQVNSFFFKSYLDSAFFT